MSKNTQVIENLLRETVSVLKESGYALQGGDSSATNTAIMQALAKEENATANKNEILVAIEGLKTLIGYTIQEIDSI